LCEVEELGYEDVGDFVVDVGSEEEDAVFEEAGDYVDLARAAFNCGEGGRFGASFGVSGSSGIIDMGDL